MHGTGVSGRIKLSALAKKKPKKSETRAKKKSAKKQSLQASDGISNEEAFADASDKENKDEHRGKTTSSLKDAKKAPEKKVATKKVGPKVNRNWCILGQY